MKGSYRPSGRSIVVASQAVGPARIRSEPAVKAARVARFPRRRRRRRDRLFSDDDLREFLVRWKREMESDIDARTRFLSAPLEDLTSYFYDRFRLEPVRVLRDQAEVEEEHCDDKRHDSQRQESDRTDHTIEPEEGCQLLLLSFC